MKYVFFILVVCTSVLKAQTRSFAEKFEITNQYCGGAAPTEEVLASTHKKKPFANKTIYMYKKGKCVDSLVTDSLGWVKKRIRYGKYELFLAYKHFKQTPIGTEKDFDMECMKKEWVRADGFLDLSWRGTRFVNHRIGFKFCDWQYPCLKERHIPPSAPKQN
jgi:hypothetical protein